MEERRREKDRVGAKRWREGNKKKAKEREKEREPVRLMAPRDWLCLSFFPKVISTSSKQVYQGAATP